MQGSTWFLGGRSMNVLRLPALIGGDNHSMVSALDLQSMQRLASG